MSAVREVATVRLLRALLWIGLGAAVVAGGELAWSAAHRARPASSQMFDFEAIAQAARALLLALGLLTTLPLLAALRWRRAAIARAATIVQLLLLGGASAASWNDVRGNADCGEMRPAILVVPAWLVGLALLASSRAGARALGLPELRLARAAHLALLAGVALLVLADLASLALARRPAAERLPRLAVGMPRRDLLALLDGACTLTAQAGDGPWRFACAPRGPRWGRCAPAPVRTLEVRVDAADRVAAWRTGTAFGAVLAEGDR